MCWHFPALVITPTSKVLCCCRKSNRAGVNYFCSSHPALLIYALYKCLKSLKLLMIADLEIQLKDKDKCRHHEGATWLCGMVDWAALLDSEEEQSMWNIGVAAELRQSCISVLKTHWSGMYAQGAANACGILKKYSWLNRSKMNLLILDSHMAVWRSLEEWWSLLVPVTISEQEECVIFWRSFLLLRDEALIKWGVMQCGNKCVLKATFLSKSCMRWVHILLVTLIKETNRCVDDFTTDGIKRCF